MLLFLCFQAYMALNDIDSAVESFKKALELEPNDGQWNELYIIHGNFDTLAWCI